MRRFSFFLLGYLSCGRLDSHNFIIVFVFFYFKNCLLLRHNSSHLLFERYGWFFMLTQSGSLFVYWLRFLLFFLGWGFSVLSLLLWILQCLLIILVKQLWEFRYQRLKHWCIILLFLILSSILNFSTLPTTIRTIPRPATILGRKYLSGSITKASISIFDIIS